jgi:hypothetical protein
MTMKNVVFEDVMLCDRGDNVLLNLRFLQEPHGVTYQKTAFFIVTAV